MFLKIYSWSYSSTHIPVLAMWCSLLGWWLLFNTLMGGTTTVLTAGLFSLVSGCSRLAWGSWFWFWLVKKRLSGKGLSWGPREESEGGEPSTVSHPLSWPSSSDILQWGRGGKKHQYTRGFNLNSVSTCVEYKMPYLLGLLHGEGLDCAEAEELVLRLLSGLLREHTRSMFREPVHASHSGLPLHL